MNDYEFRRGVERSEAAHLDRFLAGPTPAECLVCGRPCDEFADLCDFCEDVADRKVAG